MADVLVFHPALAPYRVQFFNWLARISDCHVLFLSRQVPNQAFSRDVTFDRLRAGYSFVERKISLVGRELPIGVASHVRKHAPKIVIATEFSPVTLMLCGLKQRYGFRLLTIVDESPGQVRSASFLKRLARWLALKAMDGLVVLSEEVRTAFRAAGYEGEIAVLPLVQDEAELRSHIKRATDVAEKWLDAYQLQECQTVLYVGRLAPEKNLGFLLESFAHLKRSRPEARLVMVGEGPERQPLVADANRLGIGDAVIMPGRLEGDELYGWYLVADVFVLPSSREPYGAVVNEALAFGLPVVCSRHAGAAALIEGKHQGMVLSIDDPAAFAKGVDDLLEEGRSDESRMPFSFGDAQKEFNDLVWGLLK